MTLHQQGYQDSVSSKNVKEVKKSSDYLKSKDNILVNSMDTSEVNISA